MPEAINDLADRCVEVAAVFMHARRADAPICSVKRTPRSPETLITDVGFGVSQILPVLVLLYYVPEGSTVLLEQPGIHLHPSVQTGLADVFIDAAQSRGIQSAVPAGRGTRSSPAAALSIALKETAGAAAQ